MFEAAEALPTHPIKVGNLTGTECELGQIVERFGELCEDAARHTDATIALYEFMPYDVNVNDIEKALAVVEGANAPNGGRLALDTWHLGKLRLEPEELRRIPPRFVSWVELSDGPYEYAEDRLDEVINRRRLPGDGEFPIGDYVPCAELGYDGPWGVEVLSKSSATFPSSRSSNEPTATSPSRRALRKEPRCPRTACRRSG